MRLGNENARFIEKPKNGVDNFVGMLDVGENICRRDDFRRPVPAPCFFRRAGPKKAIVVGMPRSFARLPTWLGSMPKTRWPPL